MDSLQKSLGGSLVSVTIKAIFNLILGTTVNIQNHQCCEKEILLCVLLKFKGHLDSSAIYWECQSKSNRSRWRPRCLRETWAVTTGRWETQSSNTSTIRRYPAISQDLWTSGPRATCESSGGQLVAAAFSSICSSTSSGRAQKTGSSQLSQVGRWLAGKKSPEEGMQFHLSSPKQLRVIYPRDH